ncbi:MAG: vanadium-dependent haloperoxidase [Longimicrobiaceae bacterium]
MRTQLVSVMLMVAVLQAGCGREPGDYRARAADAEPLHTAMQELTGTIVYDIFSPPQASRAYAYASIAAYEALRHDHPEFQTLAGQVNGLTPVPAPEPGAEHYLPLASVHAFMTVGKALTFSSERMDSLHAEMHQRFRGEGIPAPVFERSVAYGDRVAQHILDWMRQDHFLEIRGYPKFTVTSAPGRWVPTPPTYMDAVEPNWAQVRPFALDSAGQFRPNPPLPFDMTEGSPFFRQVQEVYEAGKQLTDEQRQIAEFWNNNPYTMNIRGHAMFATKKVTPGGHWMGIVAIAARKSGADLMQSTEAYVRTAIAMADGFLACWEEKFRSNLVRPETVINAHLDEQWVPTLQTPPFPEYTSGHSVISTAAATVLTHQFGEGFAFDDDTEVEYGLPVRSFSSFEEAAAEAAMSRLYGGIHYRMAIEEGVIQGRKVGDQVIRRLRTRVEGAEPARTANSVH